MATYTGNPTATQAPGPQPAPVTPPISNLVVDGTAINAASVNQQTKEANDFLAWLSDPRAQLAAGSVASHWGDPIFAYKNALLFRRFAIDHHGLPAGQLIDWNDDWNYATPNLSAAGTGNWIGRWLYRITTGGIIGANGGTGQPMLSLTIPTPGGGLVNVESAAPITPVGIPGGTVDGDHVITMQWSAYPQFLDAGDSEQAMGLALNGSNSGAGKLSVSGAEAAAFVRRQSDGNWQFYTKAVGGGASYVDTGVFLATSLVRFRIEIIGSSTSDDATARAIGYINGVQVANVPVAIRQPKPFFQLSSGGFSACGMLIGPVSVRANLCPGDALL
jgi:hypothetical protein